MSSLRVLTAFLALLSTATLAATPISTPEKKKAPPTECADKKNCPSKKSWLDTALNDITGTKDSALDERIEKENQINKNKFGLTFYEPTYVLPFYYTGNPDQNVGETPNNQSIMSEELKAQLSFQFPLWPNMFDSHWSIAASYTQLNYWQVYAKSQYFRETDYTPAFFVRDHFLPNWLVDGGIEHQSNGRGGNYERSWNRAYINLNFSGTNWLIMVNPWVPIFCQYSSDLHNSDITRYLGYERIIVAYKFSSQELSMMLRNSFESGFQRLGLELDYSFPIHGFLKGYIQYFHGYGQSLIEYNQKTNSAGIGITLSNWI